MQNSVARGPCTKHVSGAYSYVHLPGYPDKLNYCSIANVSPALFFTWLQGICTRSYDVLTSDPNTSRSKAGTGTGREYR